MKINIPQKAAQILKTLNAAGYEAYVVGGCVRDSILGREPGDWDITTSALPEQVKELFQCNFPPHDRYGNPAWNSNGNDG